MANDQGFPAPTKAPHVKKVLRGIAELHPLQQKRAKPLQLDQLKLIDQYIDSMLSLDNPTSFNYLKLLRDRALILIGFWRAFRSDELTRITVENVQILAGQGTEIYIPRSKTDRTSNGRHYKAPALNALCPVLAFQAWIEAAQLESGPVFPRISRWGHIGENAMHPASIIAIIKNYCVCAGIPDAEGFSSHSLRRGFASWASSIGWDTKTLMEYVGWRDVHSAMKYIESKDSFSRERIETSLVYSRPSTSPEGP